MEQIVRRYGSAGPTVLCLHGGPGAPGELAPVAQHLAAGFRVLEPFERRSGSEPLTLAMHTSDLAQLLREEAVPRAALIGFSSGAITALTFAASYPERCSAMVLVGAATLTAEARREFKRRLEDRLGSEASARLAELQRMPVAEERLEAQAALLAKAYLVDPASLPEPVWVDAPGHRETWKDMLRLQETGDHPRAFRAVACPVLMIHGTEDPHPGTMIRDSLHLTIPRLEYVELAACGHYPWLERAASEEFYRVLDDWLTANASA